MTADSKMLYDNAKNTARRLYKSSGGIMFLFLLVLSVLRWGIFYPAGRRIWALVFMLLPDHYISNQNILSVLKSPLVLAVGLGIIIAYGLLVLWETSGLLLILEYHYQGKTVRLWKLFVLSARQILHAVHPRNWVILLYALVMMPLTDLFSVSSFISRLTLPEYISEFIMTTWWADIAFVIANVFCAWLVLHWLFSYEGFVLERSSFSRACKRSRVLVKRRLIRTIWQLALYEIRTIFICTIPVILIFIGLYIASYFLGMPAAEANNAARNLVIGELGQNILFSVCGIIIKMKMLSFLFSLYHVFRDDCGVREPIMLPDWGVKVKGRTFRFRFLSGAIYAVLTLSILGLYCGLGFCITHIPDIAGALVNETQVAAHKGYSIMAPENTMAAFEEAISCGDADMIEFDVRRTKDGIPVVIHDASILKACGVKKDVYDMTLEELRSYTANYQFSDGKYHEVVPTLEEVLAGCGGQINLLVEIKASDRSPGLPAQIIEMLKQYDCLDQSVIQSGSYEALCEAKKACPDIPCGLIMAIGIGNYYDMPNVDFFSLEHSFVSSSIVDTIHKRGKQVYVWTVNESSSLEKTRYLGADVIITDRPEYVSSVLRSNNLDLKAFLGNAIPDTGGVVDVSDGD